MILRRLAPLFAALACLAFAAAPSRAQDYPNRIVRIVVAFPAGGPTDFVARVLADKLKGILGQNVIIENKPGANAAIGADRSRSPSRTATRCSSRRPARLRSIRICAPTCPTTR